MTPVGERWGSNGVRATGGFQLRGVLLVLTATVLLMVLPGYSAVMSAGRAAAESPATWRPASVQPQILASGAAVIIMGLLLLLYLYRRRLYILYWIGGWACIAGSMFAGSRAHASGQLGGLVYGGSHFLSIGSALWFLVAADAYRRAPRLRRVHLMLLLPVGIWFLLAPIALGAMSVFAPGHLLTALTLLMAGGAHLVILRDARLLGAGVVGVMLLITALTNVTIAIRPASAGDVLSDTFLLQLAFYLVTALGMQLMTFEDMTCDLRRANLHLETAQSELRQLVVTDALTGCRNRRFFDEIIGHELSTHRRYGTPLSLLFVDVDHFKAINDTLGHPTGDRVLREVASLLMRKTRDADYVFRWGGDEFLLLVSCHEDEAVRRGYELQQEFAALPITMGLPRGVGLSFGCAEVPNTADSTVDVLKLADERMYSNKRNAGLPSGGRVEARRAAR